MIPYIIIPIIPAIINPKMIPITKTLIPANTAAIPLAIADIISMLLILFYYYKNPIEFKVSYFLLNNLFMNWILTNNFFFDQYNNRIKYTSYSSFVFKECFYLK